MNPWDGLLYGLSVAFTVEHLIAALVGALLGTVMGLVPGIGPVSGAAILLPLTYVFDPLTGMIVIAGMFYGIMYGGSTTSVLLNIPGDAPSVVSAFEGYPLAQSGRAGPALGITAIASFIGGTGSVIVLSMVAAPVAQVAIVFGSAEYFALTLGGLLVLARIMGGSLTAGLLPLAFGLLLGVLGEDAISGDARFTFGVREAYQGVSIVALAVGLFGLTEILRIIIQKGSTPYVGSMGWRQLIPTKSDMRNSVGSWFRGSGIGFGLGLLPGPSISLATLLSYRTESMVGRDRHKFGKGAVSGLAGPESANNAAATSSMIPLLALGLPFSATLAVMLVAMQVHGIQPGPQLVTTNPDLFWGLIASLLIGNVMLLLLNVNLIRVWVAVLRVPNWALLPSVVALCWAGVYTFRLSWFDLAVAAALAVIGFFMVRYNFQLVPVLLGALIGPLVERHFRQGLTAANGDLSYFITQPIAAGIWIAVLFVIVALPLVRWFLGRRRKTTMVTTANEQHPSV
ncbi:MAG: tripartite tricarboxylate transporter permease [Yaniella sp.]|uniref:tripartite tricarboxylate transporter permease n=1 Tax=Yaniella sp. TaxID=2773929 RepID=UPI002647E773|nr:tripartite tricarboxylate transporter permease [Yaniella sp.]MDN6759334.1 tripartite tricarboxylate transporter permease [Yaniella sp.]